MHRSKIEWVLNPDNKTLGKIWNPITGCLNGCEYCYARRLANGRLKHRYWANDNLAPTPRDLVNYSLDPFYPRFWEDRLYEPCHIKKPSGIFTVDMGELFGDWIPEEWQKLVFSVIEACPQHRFYLLTKQPQNLIKFSPFPSNCYVGVTITCREAAHIANFYLPEIKAGVKFISFEPLLDDVMQYRYTWNLIRSCNWIIIGSQTKPLKLPQKIWVDEIIEAADKSSIPVFLKDNLKPLLGDNLRQELPE